MIRWQKIKTSKGKILETTSAAMPTPTADTWLIS